MPRISRGLADNHIYHVLNRGNGRENVSGSDDDFAFFGGLLGAATERCSVSLLAWCLLPDHFHLLLRPILGPDLSRFMQWLMTSHVRGHHRHHNSSGHVWQGRFKSFLVKDDEYLLTVLHYIEGNPVRAGIVNSARCWPWSSHQERTDSTHLRRILADPPILLPEDWTAYVNQPLGANELECLGQSVRRQTPYGNRKWQIEVCDRFGLASTLRRRGRPKKG